MERAILVNVAVTKAEKNEAEESVEELAGLAVAAGAEVAGTDLPGPAPSQSPLARR